MSGSFAMSKRVKVKARPGSTVRFPAICIRCSQEASERLSISKRSGRLTRLIDLPICDDCYRELQRQSAEEERLQKISRLAFVGAPLLVLILVFVVFPSALAPWLRLGAGLLLALVTYHILRAVFRHSIRKAALPEKSAILDSACMVDFSWRATTFKFENELFAERFSELNENQLMEV
jgi:hypothetical protein